MQHKDLGIIAPSCEMGAIYGGFQAFWNDGSGSLVVFLDFGYALFHRRHD